MQPTADRRFLRTLARAAERAQVARARAAVKDARARKKTARTRTRTLCQDARAAFKQWRSVQAVELRKRVAELRAELKAGTLARRAKVKACCSPAERVRVRAQSDAAIAAARAELARVRTLQRSDRVIEARAKPATLKATRHERRAESDHEVEVNLTPDELIVWRKVRSKIKPSGRMSRTEAFSHWMHDHSAEVGRILAEDADHAYTRAIAEQKREYARMRKLRQKGSAADVVAELQRIVSVRPPRYASAVPF